MEGARGNPTALVLESFVCRDDLFPSCGAVCGESLAEFGVCQREDLCGEESCVCRTSRPDADSRHGDSAGHLDRRQKRIHSVECTALDRDSNHRQKRVRRNGPRKMGRAAGRRDNHAVAILNRVLGKLRNRLGVSTPSFLSVSMQPWIFGRSESLPIKSAALSAIVVIKEM